MTVTGRKRRVLAIAHIFPPAAPIGTLRPLRVVRRLVEEGWDATVLMASPRTYSPGMPFDPTLLDRVPPEVRVVQAPVIRPVERLIGWVRVRWKAAARDGGALAQKAAGPSRPSLVRGVYNVFDDLTTIPDKEMGWIAPAFVKGLITIIRERPDVLYSTAPPWTAQVVALALAKVTRRPWVADFRDPWARAPWRETQPQIIRRAAVLLERWVVGRADAILFATRTNCDEYIARYGAETGRKFHVVLNGCDPAEFARSFPTRRVGPFVMVHAGSLYGARSPVPLFRAIAAMIRRGAIDARHFRLRLIGVSTSGDFRIEASELGLEDVVEFVPRMPRAQVIDQMAAASCLLVLQPGTTVSIPGKLYEYLAVGRPVLALSEEGELSDLVRSSGVGIAVRPADSSAIEAALERVIALERDEPVRRPPAYLYDGNQSAGEAVDVLGKVAQKRRVDRQIVPAETKLGSR
jgi:glycosyltransferase involved in cell wall biosynthesis